jgi:nicotinamidase-related amidase
MSTPTTNRELGVWKAEDCVLVLIDYQKEMFEVIRSETTADLVDLNVRLLAKAAKAFDLPIVLSTVGVEIGFNGPTRDSVLSELEGVEPIDRSSMNAFEDGAFREALAATGRKRLIIGGRSQTAHRTAIERLSHAGAVPTTALAIVTELFRDWASPLAGPAGEVIYWYFREVPGLTDEVRVAEAEKEAAAGAVA